MDGEPPVYEVRLSEAAEADIDATYLYLNRISPELANRWHEGLLAAVSSLSYLPQRCPLAPENDAYAREVRQLLYRHGRTAYRVLFTAHPLAEAEPPLVRVLRIRHAARQWLTRPDHSNGHDE